VPTDSKPIKLMRTEQLVGYVWLQCAIDSDCKNPDWLPLVSNLYTGAYDLPHTVYNNTLKPRARPPAAVWAAPAELPAGCTHYTVAVPHSKLQHRHC
jgi:hypothetical protein